MLLSRDIVLLAWGNKAGLLVKVGLLPPRHGHRLQQVTLDKSLDKCVLLALHSTRHAAIRSDLKANGRSLGSQLSNISAARVACDFRLSTLSAVLLRSTTVCVLTAAAHSRNSCLSACCCRCLHGKARHLAAARTVEKTHILSATPVRQP